MKVKKQNKIIKIPTINQMKFKRINMDRINN